MKDLIKDIVEVTERKFISYKEKIKEGTLIYVLYTNIATNPQESKYLVAIEE